MDDLCGGAEAHARSNQYRYRANSSLVLAADSLPGDTNEPTGEPETLRGRINPRSFGDRAVRNKPPERKDANSRRKRSGDALPSRGAKRGSRGPTHQDVSILSLTDDGVYRPQTKETRAAYEALLSIIQQHLGGQPLGVLGGAADEVLATLKDDKIKNPDKKKEIEKLISTISDQTFDQLVSIRKIITDFHGTTGDSAGGAPSCDGMGTTLDGDIGVSVVFEESDDDDEPDFDQVQDELDEDDVTELNGPGGMQVGGELDDDDMPDSNQGLPVNVQDIDA